MPGPPTGGGGPAAAGTTAGDIIPPRLGPRLLSDAIPAAAPVVGESSTGDEIGVSVAVSAPAPMAGPGPGWVVTSPGLLMLSLLVGLSSSERM